MFELQVFCNMLYTKYIYIGYKFYGGHPYNKQRIIEVLKEGFKK
jgi:hypothetical protein